MPLSLAVLFLLPFLTHGDSISCWTCASDELRGRWELTGLPRIAETYFSSSCGSLTTLRTKESCGGPCFSMLFDNPDSTPDSPAGTFFVRGCHSTLMQVTTNRSSANSGTYCELDTTYPMADSRGAIQHTNMLMEFCSRNECNVRKTYQEDPPCTQQSSDLLNNQQIQCYDCTPKQGSNCKEGRATKKYCMKQTVKLGGAYQTFKTATNVNLVGIDNYCQQNDVVTTPGGVAVKNRYQQCYCKNKQFCNGSSLPLVFVSLIFPLLTV